MLGKIIVEGDKEETFPFYNPNSMNLVEEVSTKVRFVAGRLKKGFMEIEERFQGD